MSAVEPTRTPRRRRRKSAREGEFTDPHVLRGLAYCRSVVGGSIPACKYVRQACQRSLDDLERAKDPAWPYEFDEVKAGRAARFLELIPHVKGPLAGKLLRLEDWQCWIQTSVYGWVRRASGAGLRRFRHIYEEVPRGNGKSFFLAGNSLLMLCRDGESGAEIAAAAVDREQAKRVYGEAELLLNRRPALREALGIEVSAHAIYHPATQSRFMALSRDAKKSGDGLNLHFVPVDELHAHPDRRLYDVLKSGAGKRPQSLIWTITTAGFNTGGICYERRKYVLKVLAREVIDEEVFGVIYTIDDGDDWATEEALVKANPNWNASIDQPYVLGALREALHSASNQTNYKTKHLDVWENADMAWMNMREWDRCGDPDLDRERFQGQPCFLALDLAYRNDVCAKVLLFPQEQPHRDPVRAEKGDKEMHYYLFLDSFLPEAQVELASRTEYKGWWREERIIATPGAVLDLSVFQASVEEDTRLYDVKECGYDPAQATKLAQDLTKGGVPMVEVRPLVLTFSPAMKEAEALVLDGRLHHDANPVMRWMISNVVCHRDAKDNIYPRKEQPEQKIDGAVALFMALARAQTYQPPAPPQSYMERGEMALL